ncbi:MAG TPA: glycosyltransferase family 4 protein [Phocaeicola coprocola]|uniref:Glycosyltransferase family 4 protein n=1 Tax=Phocaeicola coprocola TaxID=310298 RepID=A0A921FFJ4_9BACT|nr:glycosyltransferase family 4 protein [Phocaeicola coprocola]
MKIVYSINSIRGLGGIQKVTLLKANTLAEIPDNDVYIIVTDNWMHHPLTHELSPKIHFINLEINYYKDDYKSRLHQILSNFKLIKHYFKLQKAISQIKPNIIISVGQSEKYIVPLLHTKAIKIREIHFNSNYRDFTYKSKILAKILKFLDYKVISKGYDKIVLLTKEDKDTFFPNNNKYTYIHNPLTFEPTYNYNNNSNYIIAVGRLSTEKDFLSLIKAWSLIYQKCPNWKIKIVGDGPEKNTLEEEIKKLQLSNSIELSGYSNNIKKEMSNSSIFVMTSYFEGFGLVLLEAMACGLPPIAFSCQFGPRDIITDGKNGLLVYNRDIKSLSEKLIYLIQYPDIRKEMSNQALARVNDFSINSIIDEWMKLFQSELSNRKTC